MSRIEPVTLGDPAVDHLLSKTIQYRGHPLNAFTVLARYPRLLLRINQLGGLFLAEGHLAPRLREMVILRVAKRVRCPYELAQHARIAAQVGLSPLDERSAIGDPDDLAPDDRYCLRLVDELLSTDMVCDDVWRDACSVLTPQQTLELVLLVGYYRMFAGYLNACQVELESGVAIPTWLQ